MAATACKLASGAPATLSEAAAPAAAVAGVTLAVAPRSTYLTTPIYPDYAGKETGEVWGTSVNYLSAEERKAYVVAIKSDGLAYNAQGELPNTQAAKLFL